MSMRAYGSPYASTTPAERRQRDAAGRVGAGQPAEVARLRRADRRVAVVVQHEQLDRQLQPPRRLQFLDVQLQAAVAVDADGAAPPVREAGADQPRQAVAHRAERGRQEQPLPFLQPRRQAEDLDARAGAARHDDVVRRRGLRDRLAEHVRADAVREIAVLGKDDGVFRLPFRAIAQSQPERSRGLTRSSWRIISTMNSCTSAQTGTSMVPPILRSSAASTSTMIFFAARAKFCGA